MLQDVPLQRASSPVIMPVNRPVANVVVGVVATPSSATPLPTPNLGSERVTLVPVSLKISGWVWIADWPMFALTTEIADS